MLEGQAAATWLLEQAGEVVLRQSVSRLTRALQLPDPYGDPGPSAPDDDPSLELRERLGGIVERLDEDRLASLVAGFEQLRSASHTTAARGDYIGSALRSFHALAALPRSGTTGGVPNQTVRAAALLGIAAGHVLLGDEPRLCAEALVGAVDADRHLALPVAGRTLVAKCIAGSDYEVTDRSCLPVGPVARAGTHLLCVRPRTRAGSADLVMLDLEIGRESWQVTVAPPVGESAATPWTPTSAFSPDGAAVAVTGSAREGGRALEVRTVVDGRIVGRHDAPDLIGVLPAGDERMVSAHEDGILCLWTWSGQELRGPAPFCTVGHGIEDMQASWDGSWIAVKDAAAPASMFVLGATDARLRARRVLGTRWRHTPFAVTADALFWAGVGTPLQAVGIRPGDRPRVSATQFDVRGVQSLSVAPEGWLLSAVTSTGSVVSWRLPETGWPDGHQRCEPLFESPPKTARLVFNGPASAVVCARGDSAPGAQGVYVRRLPR